MRRQPAADQPSLYDRRQGRLHHRSVRHHRADHRVIMETTAGPRHLAWGGAGRRRAVSLELQRHTPPAHTAIILSMETVFAALGGWLILDETLPFRGLAGCGLMLAGILISRLGSSEK